MNAVTSITAAKMKALREAKKLGCSGAHQTDDGIWRPCSSAEALSKIIPSNPSGVSGSIGPRRQQRGNNNMRRQWEPLGARGVVSIDTLAGGGLVSGVVGKQYQPAAPRDEDPDVFTDIEVARDRSRQLGCIGVSRRTSRSGRTVWMPCTNMSDLANRTGRTSLGRRNMQKRTERFIADVVRRNQPKATRSRKKSLYDDLHGNGDINTKGLGPKVGRRIGRGLRAAPAGFVFIDITGAIDADKDGIVFEGLPLERPIIPRFIIPEGTARRVQNLIGTTAQANEQNRRNGLSVDGAIDKTVLSQIIGTTPNDVPDKREDPLLSKLRNVLGSPRKPSAYTQSAVEEDERVGFGDPNLEISRFSARFGKREAAGSVKALDAVDDEYEYFTTGELSDLVAQLVPGSNEELMDALKSSPYTKKNAKQIYKRIVDAEPDYEATLSVRKILQDELFRNPGVRNAIRRYGIPPIVVTGYEPDIANMGFVDITSGPRMWQSIIGGYAANGFIAFNSGVFPDPDTGRIRDSLFRDEDLDSLVRHELAHAWQFMAAKQGGPARDYLISMYQELQENLQQGRGNAASQNYSEALYRSVTWGSEEERASARRISSYAETARLEWFAESFAAFTDDDPSSRMRVDNTSIKNMADVWGMSVNEFLTFVGERNQDQLSERARSSSTRSVSNLLLGEMSKPEKEAHNWLLNNPNYIADAPDAMLLRLPPDMLDNFIRNQRMSTRSRYNTDISKAEARAEEARRNGELGQRVLDALFARATGENSSSRPTMWFVGGTTGSGKSTLRGNGVLTGVPDVDTAVDIDPDVIKSMHPDWDNGRGASAVHGWSTQWALYGMRQATAQNRDYVVTGTGVRVDQMLIGKDNGYRIIGHYVHVPTDIAEKRMASRGKQGGVQLPSYLASQYAAELQWKVRKAITNGYMDEFHLWDNSQDESNATLAAIRREDGTFEIFNRKVFNEFFGKEGALAVEKYWESQRAENTTGSVLASIRSSSQHSGFSTRSSRNRNLPERLIVESLPNKRTTLYRKDVRGKRTSNAELSNVVLGSDVDLSDSAWNSAYLYGVTADNLKTSQPINFSNAVLKAVSLKNTIIPPESSMKRSTLERVAFDGSDIFDVDFSEASLRGVDFSKAKVGNINLRGAILERVEFDVADLSNSGLTIDQLQGSGIIWTDRTKFSPEIQQFINSLPSGRVLKENGKYSFKVNAESTTPINRADKGYAQLRQTILGRRQIQIPTPQSDGQAMSGIDATGGKISDADWKALTGNRITSSYMDRLSAIKQNINDVKITHSWMDDAHFTGSRLQDVSLSGSSLRRASFRGADIRGVLNLRGTDLRLADFNGAKVDVEALSIGTIDLRDADLTEAKLGNVPLGRLKLDNAILKGAVWNGPTSMIPKDLRDRGLTGTRSMSRQTSYGAAIQINDLSDRLSNATRLSSREKTELVQDMSSMYRELLDSKIERPERQEFADFIESLKDASSKDLDRFRVPTMDKRPMLLIESARANNKESFVERFKKVRENEPEFMKGLSAIQAWKQASSAADKTDELENLHMQALDELREERAVAQSLPQLQNILHGDFLDADNRKRPTGKLPSGKRAKETIITDTESPRLGRTGIDESPSVSEISPDQTEGLPEVSGIDTPRSLRSTRSTALDELSDEEIRALATRKGLTEQDLGDLYKAIVDARDFIRRNKGESFSYAPGLGEENARRMRDSIRVEMAPNGVPMVMAEPFEAVIDEVPDKRDWSKVLAPSIKDIERLVDAIRKARDSDSPILEELSEESRDRVTKAAYYVGEPESPFDKIISQIFEKLGSTEYQGTSTGAYDSWVGIYLEGLADPKRMQAGLGSDGIHDFFGHFGVGRGFDRHGEWAAALVTDSLIRDHPAFDFLTPDERESLRREFFTGGAGGALRLRQQLETEYEQRFGIPMDFATQRYDIPSGTFVDVVDTRTPEERDTAEVFKEIGRITYGELAAMFDKDRRQYFSMDEILDLLGVPPTTTRSETQNGSRILRSTRSSRNSTPLTEASNELLLSIAGNEAAIKKERSMRSTRSGRREMTDSEKQRLKPVNMEVNEKKKFQPGTTLVYTDRDDRVIRTELVGPQVLRIRGIEGVNVYIDPTPDNQDEVDARMRQWEIDYGPVSSPSRQAQNTGGQAKRDLRERDRPQTTANEDPLDRILREAEENERKKQEVSKAWQNLSTRSRTDTYAILDEKNFEDILDELELYDAQKDIARTAFFQLYYAVDGSTFLKGQKEIDEIKKLLSGNTIVPIDEKTKEAIKSISIKVSSNGIPVIFAQPHPTISSILPNREWSEIEAPSREYLKRIFDELQNRTGRQKPDRNPLRKTSSNRNNEARRELEKKFNKQFRDIVRKLQGHESDDGYKEHEQLDGSWVQQYLGLLLNPARGSAVPDIEHDILGHFGTGRGFDRHGEWANAMAITSLILDSDLFDLNEEERDAMAMYWLEQYGFAQIFKQFTGREDRDEEVQRTRALLEQIWNGETGAEDYGFDGSTRELIAILDGENINRESTRSASTRSIKLTEASPELLLRAEKEASRDRSEFVLKSTLLNLSSRPDKNEIIRGVPKSKPRSGGRSIQSLRSTRLISSTTPQLRISEDGSRAYMDASAKEAFLRDPKRVLNGLTEADIPEGYFPKGQRNKLEQYKQDLLALATLDSLVPNTEGYGVSARNLFAIDVLDASKPNPPMDIQRGIRRGILGTRRTEKIFHQADVVSLKVDEALFVTDIPATSKMSAIDNAIIFRNTDGSLSLIEIENADELDVIEGLMDEAKQRVNENGVGVFMLNDIIPPSPASTVSPVVKVLENYHTTIADIDPRIPRPNIIFKADFFAQQIPGFDPKQVAGTAYPDNNSIVLWRTSEELPSVDIMLHEFGHSVDFTLGHRVVRGGEDISYSSDYNFSAVADDWEPATESDEAHGYFFGEQNMQIAVLANTGQAEQPTSAPGTTYRNIALERDTLHGPRIGDKFITKYAQDTGSLPEDFAESASLFLRDKMFGYAISLTSPSGERREYTFAEMYPNRAAILEKVLYPSTRSASKFDARFKSAYGADPIYGDGDCYEAASNMASRLRGEEFGFSDDQIRIVHGVPLGTGGDATGIRYGHAWAEVAKNGWDKYEQLRNEIAEVLREAENLTSQSLKNSLAARHNKLMMELVRMELEDVAVYDFSNGNEHIIPKYLYYKIGNIEDENTRYYSRRDADIKMQADETYGPWE